MLALLLMGILLAYISFLFLVLLCLLCFMLSVIIMMQSNTYKLWCRFNKGWCLPVYFCVFGVFSPVCFALSVPVQMIAWKDSVSEMTYSMSSATYNTIQYNTIM